MLHQTQEPINIVETFLVQTDAEERQSDENIENNSGIKLVRQRKLSEMKGEGPN